MKYFVTFFAASAALLLTSSAYAAEITLVPQERVVGLDTPFTVSVRLTADVPVNVIDLAIQFPPELEPVDISDGNSVVPMWIEKPSFDQTTRILTLTGMIPNGFSGADATIAAISVRAHMANRNAVIQLLDSSHVYRNDPPGVDDPINTRPLSIDIDAAKNNIATVLPDPYPPEAFMPEVARVPMSSGEAWAVVFATQDKGSGIDHYEVREVDPLMPWVARWHIAESPYLLTDQTLGSRIDVRAYDMRGNVRETSVLPSRAYSVVHTGLLALLFVLGILVVVVGIRLSWKYFVKR